MNIRLLLRLSYIFLVLDLLIRCDHAFDPSSDVQVAVWIFSADVATVQPTFLIERFLRFFFHVQVSHEHVSTFHADLLQ